MEAVTSPVSVIRCCWCSSFTSASELQIVSSMLQQMCDGCHSPPSLKKRRGLLFGEERARTGSDSYPGAPAAAATVALAESVFKVGNCTTSPSPSSNEKTKTKDEKSSGIGGISSCWPDHRRTLPSTVHHFSLLCSS
ncbi:hypothetical protein TYRP_008844 [Tyrophagus putrescentiae]|nr:hypothetical protein TYRP_008844 [Tyrophagus putrescentiae]